MISPADQDVMEQYGSRTRRDAKWAEHIRSGNRAAFEALFRTYAEGLCEFTQQYVNSPEVAEELVQDLFLKIWRRRHTWNPSRSAKAYLYTAARNQALDYLKHERVVRAWEQQARHHQKNERRRLPDDDVEYRELVHAVSAAIEHLPERRRLVFVLSREHGLTYREIADVLDISIKTVETQMSRAFRTLRELLASYLSFLLLLFL